MIRILLISKKMFQQITFCQTRIFQYFSGLYQQKQISYFKQTHIVCAVQDESSTSTPFMQKCSVSVRKWISSIRSRLLLNMLLNKMIYCILPHQHFVPSLIIVIWYTISNIPFSLISRNSYNFQTVSQEQSCVITVILPSHRNSILSI